MLSSFVIVDMSLNLWTKLSKVYRHLSETFCEVLSPTGHMPIFNKALGVGKALAFRLACRRAEACLGVVEAVHVCIYIQREKKNQRK